MIHYRIKIKVKPCGTVLYFAQYKQFLFWITLWSYQNEDDARERIQKEINADVWYEKHKHLDGQIIEFTKTSNNK